MWKNVVKILLFVFALFAVTIACGGSSNEGTVVTPNPPVESEDAGDSNDQNESPEEPVKTGLETFKVGDLVEVQKQTIRLNSVAYEGTTLVANFSIENHDSSDLNVSSLISFSAKKSDGTLLEIEIFDCGSSGLDGKVLPGDRMRGDICWSNAKPEDGIRIYYTASLFGQGAIVWDAIEGQAEELAPSDSTASFEMFQVGELVEIKGQVIRLNSIVYTGNVLTADFTIENTGNEDIDMSSMLSMSAKTSEGVTLEQEIFDCGVSSLDGKVVPGDRMRGTICWSGASAESGIKIYYEAALFGEGAVVWEAIEGTAEPYAGKPMELGVDTYAVGDLIQLSDHTIVLNSVEFLGNILKANFTVENQGASDLTISSLLLFEARKSDGSGLEQEIFNCGSPFDGSVIAGDKLTGDICWNGASPEDGIKLYYEANLFGSGAIIWIVE